jgi:hypothetical protein
VGEAYRDKTQATKVLVKLEEAKLLLDFLAKEE